MQKELSSKAEAALQSRMKTMQYLLQSKGSEMHIADGKLLAGDYPINGNFEIPDRIKELFGGAATIFMQDERISTNVLKPDGSRAVGTKLKGPAYDAVIGQGKPFSGIVEILGVPYFTAYQPVVDRDGKVIGALYVGEKVSEYLAVYERLKYVVAGIAVVLAAGLSFVTLLLVKQSLLPLGRMCEMIEDIAHGEGDLTKRLDDSSHDEIGEVAKWLNVFMEKLHLIIDRTAQTTHRVAAASAHLHTTAERMALGTDRVAEQAGSVATAGEQMSVTSGDIAQNCARAAEGSRQTSEAAASGARVVDETIVLMNNIASRVKESAQTVESLGTRSEQIGEIVGTIEDIADQTNLLALNAAIEAARAGDQGRGFAVVADEVRALAERTSKATREISDMIRGIQQEIGTAVQAMHQGVHEVSKGSDKAAESGQALQEILVMINDVTGQIHQVATAAEEQTATTTEISGNIHQINTVLAQTSQGVQESAQAANQLSSLSEDLRQIVSQFKLLEKAA
ncbi:methyl-accepting chemotaxis protein [Geomonas sp. Red875]|uniref:Methyl-accepting chemotaxis protein n=2 Tax=Geomesophilobacter sediminis TaxID=2798584 RepID=A0A8J7LTY3_9BACT|nr:methyl-accepting chemotaxis protein [Geomesophilobacter sediminis]